MQSLLVLGFWHYTPWSKLAASTSPHILYGTSGPMFRNVEFRDGAAYVSFDCAEGMHASDGKPLQTFEVAETEDIYYPATAEIVGNQIKVYSKEVKNPLHVRYGWQPFTRANLVNGDGLPASTFRTDWGK